MLNKRGSIVKVSNWVIESKGFAFLAFLILLFFSVLSFVFYFNNPNQLSNLGLIKLFITNAGSIFATIGLLLVNRGSRNFFFFSLTGCALLFINGLISNLMFDALKWLMVGIVLLFQTFYWNTNQEIKVKKLSNILIFLIILSIFVTSLTISNTLIANINTQSPFYNKRPYLDLLQFAFTISGNIMMMFMITQSRLVYLIGNIMTIIMFSLIINSGEYTSIAQLVQAILYTIITICGYVNILVVYGEE